MINKSELDIIINSLSDEQKVALAKKIAPKKAGEFLSTHHFAQKFFADRHNASMIMNGKKNLKPEIAIAMIKHILDEIGTIIGTIETYKGNPDKLPMEKTSISQAFRYIDSHKKHIGVIGKEVFSIDVKQFKDGVVIGEDEKTVTVKTENKEEKIPKKIFKKFYRF